MAATLRGPAMITIAKADPHDPRASALLRASHALMQALFDPEENHFLSIDALAAADIAFFAAFDGDAMLGCGALADRGDYGEVKSMFVAPEARGNGVAAALIDRLEVEARARGHRSMKLETGDRLDAAIRSYARHGFAICGPFGDYEANTTSVFMQKPLR